MKVDDFFIRGVVCRNCGAVGLDDDSDRKLALLGYVVRAGTEFFVK